MKLLRLLSMVVMLMGCVVDLLSASDLHMKRVKTIGQPKAPASSRSVVVDINDNDDDDDERSVAVRGGELLGYEIIEPRGDDVALVDHGMDPETTMLVLYFNGPNQYYLPNGSCVQKKPLNREIVIKLMTLSSEQLRAFLFNVIGVVVPNENFGIKEKFAQKLERSQPGEYDQICFNHTSEFIKTYSVEMVRKLFTVSCENEDALALYCRWVGIVLDELIKIQQEIYKQTVPKIQAEMTAIEDELREQYETAERDIERYDDEYARKEFKHKLFWKLAGVADIGSMAWVQYWTKNAEKAAQLAQAEIAKKVIPAKPSSGFFSGMWRASDVVPVQPVAKTNTVSNVVSHSKLYSYIHVGVFAGVSLWTLYRLKQIVRERAHKIAQPKQIQEKAKGSHARLGVTVLSDAQVKAQLDVLRTEVQLLLDEYKVAQEQRLLALQARRVEVIEDRFARSMPPQLSSVAATSVPVQSQPVAKQQTEQQSSESSSWLRRWILGPKK